MSFKSRAKPPRPFEYFNSSPEMIRLVAMLCVRFPLSPKNLEDLLVERGIDPYHSHGQTEIAWARLGYQPVWMGCRHGWSGEQRDAQGMRM